MTGRAAPLLAAFVLWLALPTAAAAQLLDLSITPATIAFPLSDPDTVPVVSSAPVQISYRVRQNKGPWTLTVLAGGNLQSGPASIDILTVSWIATPAPPFQNGTLSSTVAQRVASGTGMVNPAQTGQLTFQLPNLWTYDAGSYTQTIVFTLSAP